MRRAAHGRCPFVEQTVGRSAMLNAMNQRSIEMMKRPTIFTLFLLLLLAACVPVTDESGVAATTAMITAVAETIVTPATAVASGGPISADREILRPSPSPTPPPSPTPTPTPLLISEMWVSGYIMGDRAPDCPFQVGSSSAPLPGERHRCLYLQPADDQIVAALTAVPAGDTLLQLTGDLLPDSTGGLGTLWVTAVTFINYPYTPDTPLDAAYTLPGLDIRLRYPTGWTIQETAETQSALITSMPPGAVSLRPGREHLDPTEVFVAIRPLAAASVDAYLQSIREGAAAGGPAPDISEIMVGDWPAARLAWTVMDVQIEYALTVNGQPLLLTTKGESEPFMARVAATLAGAETAVYPDFWACGYKAADRLQVGNLSAGAWFDVTLEPANVEAAAALAAIPVGDTWLRLTGTFYATTAQEGTLAVETVAQVTLPYTPQTPLTAVYTQTNPAFQFNYPAGWRQYVEATRTTLFGDLTYLYNTPPDTDCLRPGREHADPTEVALRWHLAGVTTPAEWVSARQENNECGLGQLGQVTTSQIGVWPVTRLLLDNCPGAWVEYVIALDADHLLVVGASLEDEPLLERVVATLARP